MSSVFHFPSHLQKREPKKRKSPTECHYEDPESTEIPSTSTKKVKTSPVKDEFQVLLRKQKKKIKIPQQKVRRKESVSNYYFVRGVIDDLRGRSLVDQETAVTLNGNISGLTLCIIQNQLKNQSRDLRGRRHNDEVKKFASALNFFRAYQFLRGVFSLPHPNSLCEWTLSVNCELGLFNDVLYHLNLKYNMEKHTSLGLLQSVMQWL